MTEVQPPPAPIPVTMESLLSDVRKIFNLQLNTFLTSFVQSTSDEQLEAFLPDDLSEVDAFIEAHVSAFVENEQPSTEDMIDGVAAIFVMAFMERLFDHMGIPDDEDEDDSAISDADFEGTNE